MVLKQQKRHYKLQLKSPKEITTKEQGLEDVEVHARFGSPRTVIAREFPADHQTDLIVMGPTGLNPVERVLVGAVTDYVTRAAQCDVIIAR